MLSIAKGANLALMFFLELGVLASAAYWGFTLNAGLVLRIVAGLGAPAVFIAVWALFGAANGATFPLTGFARAALEIVWFGGGAALLYAAGAATPAAIFAATFIVNAIMRIVWKQV
ncbi:YrdB family protein [Nonomuraea sp. NPDC046570]|uniref:YrdB family protein n=1 Tax=Nonomuraea sp. NPDC046570 TaxID=3155255 RepID=UPI0033E5626C